MSLIIERGKYGVKNIYKIHPHEYLNMLIITSDTKFEGILRIEKYSIKLSVGASNISIPEVNPSNR